MAEESNDGEEDDDDGDVCDSTCEGEAEVQNVARDGADVVCCWVAKVFWISSKFEICNEESQSLFANVKAESDSSNTSSHLKRRKEKEKKTPSG